MGCGSSDQEAPPPVPTAGQSYKSFIEEYAAAEPLRRQAELGDVQTQLQMAGQMAPGLIGLEREFSPEYNRMQMELERTLGPEWSQVQEASRQREIATLGRLAPQLREAADDPQSTAIRSSLAQSILGDVQAGSGLTPQMSRDMEQNIRAAQTARGAARGTGAVSSEALLKGLQAEQLKQQRQTIAQDFLRTQATTQIDPYTALTGRSGVMQSMPYQAPMQNFAGVGQLAGQGMAGNQQAGAQNAQLQYNFGQAQSQQGGGMLGGALSGGIMGGMAGGPMGAIAGAGLGALAARK